MNNKFKSNLNYLLHNCRNICNQSQLAKKLNIKRQSIHTYLIGEACPNYDNLIIICETYGITPNDILLTDLSSQIINKNW